MSIGLLTCGLPFFTSHGKSRVSHVLRVEGHLQPHGQLAERVIASVVQRTEVSGEDQLVGVLEADNTEVVLTLAVLTLEMNIHHVTSRMVKMIATRARKTPRVKMFSSVQTGSSTGGGSFFGLLMPNVLRHFGHR